MSHSIHYCAQILPVAADVVAVTHRRASRSRDILSGLRLGGQISKCARNDEREGLLPTDIVAPSHDDMNKVTPLLRVYLVGTYPRSLPEIIYIYALPVYIHCIHVCIHM